MQSCAWIRYSLCGRGGADAEAGNLLASVGLALGIFINCCDCLLIQ